VRAEPTRLRRPRARPVPPLERRRLLRVRRHCGPALRRAVLRESSRRGSGLPRRVRGARRVRARILRVRRWLVGPVLRSRLVGRGRELSLSDAEGVERSARPRGRWDLPLGRGRAERPRAGIEQRGRSAVLLRPEPPLASGRVQTCGCRRDGAAARLAARAAERFPRAAHPTQTPELRRRLVRSLAPRGGVRGGDRCARYTLAAWRAARAPPAAQRASQVEGDLDPASLPPCLSLPLGLRTRARVLRTSLYLSLPYPV
jgi:hypothetical protein